MGDRIQKCIVAFVPADFADDEDGIDDEAGDDDAEENNAEDQWNDAAPMIDNPTDIEKNGQGNEAGAQRNEKGDGLAAAGDAHRVAILVHSRESMHPIEAAKEKSDQPQRHRDTRKEEATAR